VSAITDVPAATPDTLSPRLTPAEAAALAEQYGLKEMGRRPPLGDYVKDTWRRRSFITVLATSKAYAKNQRSYLGQLWTVLNPTLNAAVYVLIFGIILNASRGLENAIAYITVGVFTFRFIDQAIIASARVIDSNIGLVRSHRFPRAVLPASSVLTGTTLFVPSMLVMLAFAVGSGYMPDRGDVPITWRWLLLPVVVALITLFDIGLAFFFARLGSGSPDLANVLPFMTRFLMYGSGVMFSIEHYIHTEWLANLLKHQPVAEYLTLMRMCVLHEPSIPFDWWVFVWCLGWAVLTLGLGLVFFWRREETYGRD